jgi:hypothetical protein
MFGEVTSFEVFGTVPTRQHEELSLCHSLSDNARGLFAKPLLIAAHRAPRCSD